MREAPHQDDDRVRLAQQGDRRAFDGLVRAHQDRIYRHLLHMTGSREEALDLAQDTFIKAWQALPSWRPEARFHTWLYRIASNTALDALRRRRTVEFVELTEDYDAPAHGPGPEMQLQAKQGIAALEVALARLTAEHRAIVLLREVEGLSYGEIADVLGIDEGTVKSRLGRARAALSAAYRRGEQ
jgi:RNA polymerase sigma factor (sigma-70 family)